MLTLRVIKKRHHWRESKRLEEQKAPGYNPLEFRPGYTLVTIDGGVMKLKYKPVAADASVERACRLTPG